MPTVSKEKNAAFAGVWTTKTIRAPEGTYTELLLDGNKVATFQPSTPSIIIDQILAFAKCGTNLHFHNLNDQIPRVFITVNEDEINRRGATGETVAKVEVTRDADDKQARFSLTVTAPDKGGVYAQARSQRAGEVDTVKDMRGYFVDYNKKN